MSWTHGINQEDWLRHKCQLIPELVPKIEIAPNKGYGETSIRALTLCHPNLREVYTVVRPDSDRKRVTSDWLNRISEEGLAWWYMDDGSLNHTSSGRSLLTHAELVELKSGKAVITVEAKYFHKFNSNILKVERMFQKATGARVTVSIKENE